MCSIPTNIDRAVPVSDGRTRMKDFDAQITFCYTQELAATARFHEEFIRRFSATRTGT